MLTGKFFLNSFITYSTTRTKTMKNTYLPLALMPVNGNVPVAATRPNTRLQTNLLKSFSEKANLAVQGKLVITKSAINNSVGYGLLVKRNAVINANAGTTNTYDGNTSTGYFKEN